MESRSSAEFDALKWLDALAGGICTPREYLNAVHEQVKQDSDQVWEILALLDQYYRRGKIDVELFRTLKSHLESSALHGVGETTGERPRAPAAAPRTEVPPTAAPRTEVPRTDVPRTDVPPTPIAPTLAPAPRKSAGVRTAVAIALFAVLATGGYLAVTNYVSPARLVTSVPPVVTRQESPPPAPAAQSDVVAPPSAPSPSVAAAHAPPSAPALPSAHAPPSAPALPTTSATSTRGVSTAPIRIEMASDTVDVEPTEPVARVKVRRRGNLRGDAVFTWWTESGTAKPGQDFTPVLPGVEHIADGRDSITLNIPVLSTPHGKSKSFFVVIDRDDSGGGGALGARNVTLVTIQPSD